MVLVAGLGFAGCRERPTAASQGPVPGSDNPPPAPPAEPVRVVHPAAPGSFVDLVADARPSIVTLRSPRSVVGGPGTELYGASDANVLGSGFAVEAAGETFVVTCDQVLGNAVDVTASLADDPTVYPANVLGRDSTLNVALLRVPDAKLSPLRLGASANARVGEWLVAIGVPFGYGPSVTAGLLASKNASARDGLAAPGQSRVAGYLRVDAAFDQGHVGGPVLNMAGEVVGVAAAVDPRDRRAGYAVPIDSAIAALPQLRDRGAVSRGWLGIRVQPVTTALARDLGMSDPNGAFVTEVVPGQPGAAGGLAAGDVIVALDGAYVDERNLPGVVAAHGPDKKLVARVWRGSSFQTLELTTSAVPE